MITDSARRADRWKFIGNLPVRVKTAEFVAVHASPRRPINEYIFPDDIYTNPGKFVSIFERFEKLCFVGHTHVPGVFLEGPDFYSPDELDYKFELSDEKAIVNVGSVGQPRDRDPRLQLCDRPRHAHRVCAKGIRRGYDGSEGSG